MRPSARLAWWGTAWLEGRIGPDDFLDGLLDDLDGGRDLAHLVVEVVADGSGVPILLELADARRQGATAVAAAFPVPGDPGGLRGPAELTGAAIEAGETALLLGADRALVPRAVGPVVEWDRLPAARRPPPDLAAADRGLRSAVLEAARALAALDVASWRPEVADELIDLRAGVALSAPPGTPAVCVDLAARALHLLAVTDLALADDGGAVSVGEAERRRAAIDPLAQAARQALTAACSPDGWPPPRQEPEGR
ncbi:hypothetical protein GCM10025786_38530 [Nocardioides caeni]